MCLFSKYFIVFQGTCVVGLLKFIDITFILNIFKINPKPPFHFIKIIRLTQK